MQMHFWIYGLCWLRFCMYGIDMVKKMGFVKCMCVVIWNLWMLIDSCLSSNGFKFGDRLKC